MSGEPLKLEPNDGDDDDAGEHEPAGEKKKKARGGDEPSGARTARRHAGELRGRIEPVFERLAEWRESRGDLELAAVIREDARTMSSSIVGLTKRLPAVRGPLLVVLAIVEPLLAFGRLARIVGGRWTDARARAANERELERQDEPQPAWEEMTEAELRSYHYAGQAEATAELERRELERAGA
jgi:hypothetical protein